MKIVVRCHGIVVKQDQGRLGGCKREEGKVNCNIKGFLEWSRDLRGQHLLRGLRVSEGG